MKTNCVCNDYKTGGLLLVSCFLAFAKKLFHSATSFKSAYPYKKPQNIFLRMTAKPKYYLKLLDIKQRSIILRRNELVFYS